MELLCTTTNYNFNQQSSISLSSAAIYIHCRQHPFHVLCVWRHTVCNFLTTLQHSYTLSRCKHFWPLAQCSYDNRLGSISVVTYLHKSLPLYVYSNLFFEALLFLWHRLVWCAWHKLILKWQGTIDYGFPPTTYGRAIMSGATVWENCTQLTCVIFLKQKDTNKTMMQL